VLKERLPVFVIAKDLASFDPPDHDEVERLWSIDAGLAWHSPFLAKQKENVNISRTSPMSHWS
jgi:hypothetical protein